MFFSTCDYLLVCNSLTVSVPVKSKDWGGSSSSGFGQKAACISKVKPSY